MLAKFSIPETCHVPLKKKLKIDKLDNKYVLLSHPFPLIEGELILLQPKKEDQKEKEEIIYRDYSLCKRIETAPKPEKSTLAKRKKAKKKKDEKEEEPEAKIDCKLQCLEIDIEEVLCGVEWRNFADVLSETEGLGWLQVLPVGQKSSSPLQFNMMHFLPKSKFPVHRLPLDLYISNRIAYTRKLEREGKQSYEASKDAQKNMTEREKQEDLAATHNLVLVPEFDFDHCIYPLTESVINEEGLTYAYQKIAGFMRFKTRPNLGVTLILTNRWFFCGVLTQPYCHTGEKNPVYMSGFDFAGLFTLQAIEESWPATAGYDLKQPSIGEAMAASTYLEKVVEDEETEEQKESKNTTRMSSRAF